MYRINPKVIVFLMSLIFSMATLTGAVSAINCDVNPGGNIQAVTAENPLNYAIIETIKDPAYSNAKNLVNKTKLTDKRSKEPTDHHFKKHKQGVENLRTISTGGIPPKGLDEMVSENIPQIKSMIKTVKTKITPIFSFYKKLK